MNLIDLHMHSSFSNDGDYSVDDLLWRCQQAGLSTISLTDHNSVQGVNQALDYASKYNLTVIPGIEIDCTIDSFELHILGYHIDYHDPRFSRLEKSIIDQEQSASEMRLKKICDLGILFDEKEVRGMSRNGVITGEMIAESALRIDRTLSMKKRNPLLIPFDQKENPYVDFYWEFCSLGQPAYSPIDFISLPEAVELIQSSGGIAIFAHPSKNIGQNKAILDEIIQTGVVGIEVFSNYHSNIDKDFYLTYAIEHNLIITCGSDFHGKTKPKIELGKFGFNFDDDIILKQSVVSN